MKIMQTITDYIMKSILTTHGDLVVRGAALPERLAAVALGQVLKSAGVGAKPAWGVPKLEDGLFAMGSFSRSTAGDEVVTGVGFQPSLVVFFTSDATATNMNSSIGFDTGTLQKGQTVRSNHTEIVNISGYSINMYRGGVNYIQGEITTKSADGFTVTFTLAGTASAVVSWLAIG